MSLYGLKEFDYNLRKMMDSEAFKKADEVKKFNMGYRLLNSKYGLGSFFGFGRVKKLKINDETR